MKKIFLIQFLLTSFLNFSQGNSCYTATVLTSNGTYTCPPITSGTYQQVCFASTPNINAKWYKFTAATDAQVAVSSTAFQFPSNLGKTSRLSILSGTCDAPVCIARDEFGEFLSSVQFAVQAGETYYLQWDSSKGINEFDFEFTLTLGNCLQVGQFSVFNPLYVTSNSATLKWNNAIGNPESYDIRWSNSFNFFDPSNTFDFFTLANNGASTIATIPNLPIGSNIAYFISSMCGTPPNYTGQSVDRGPFFAFLAKDLPYSVNFEQEFPRQVFTDGFIGFNPFFSDSQTEPANYADGGSGTAVFTFNSTESFSNKWGFSRALNLTAGQQVNISFKTRLFSFEGIPSPMSVKLYAGLSQTQSAQNDFITSFNITSANGYATHNATFTAPTTDVYYFGFQNNSSPGTNQTFAFFDTFSFIANPLSNQEFLKSQLKFSPIPANSTINFSNNEIEISEIEILDVNGRIIKQFIPEESINTTLNVSELTNGLYLIKATTEKGVLSQKLIKN